MAIIRTGGGVASISGSVGGTTYSHNRGGAYMRTRAVPTNPNTTFQQVIRSAVAQLASLWTTTLTDAQRAAWETYADNVLLPNALGDMINIGAVAHYIRSNVPRLQTYITDVDRVDDGPTSFNLGDYTPPVVASLTSSGRQWSITFNDADDWANEDGAVMYLYGSREQNPGVNYFKGPYRFMGAIQGNSTTPPTSPHAATNPFDVAVGNKAFMRACVSRADGRYSTPFRTYGVGA